jgi:DNA-binding Lrp family transcriptional regulator
MNATNTQVKQGKTVPVPQPPDRTDRAILKTLQRDASISNVALAEKVKLSAPACLRRVERLKQAGLIKGIVALLDNEALDAGMVVLIGVVLDRSTPESFAAFEAAAQKVSGCMECHVAAHQGQQQFQPAPRGAIALPARGSPDSLVHGVAPGLVDNPHHPLILKSARASVGLQSGVPETSASIHGRSYKRTT